MLVSILSWVRESLRARREARRRGLIRLTLESGLKRRSPMLITPQILAASRKLSNPSTQAWIRGKSPKARSRLTMAPCGDYYPDADWCHTFDEDEPFEESIDQSEV